MILMFSYWRSPNLDGLLIWFFLIICATATLSVMRRTANIAVVHLNDAGKLVVFISLAHCNGDFIQQMPGCVVANFQSAAQLNRRNTSLVRCKKINRPEPCGQRQTGAMHDGSSRHGGLVPAGTALAGVTPVDGIVLPAAANRADKALRKPKPEQLSTASILCIVTSPKFLKSNRSSLCHNIVPLHLVTILSHGSCPIFRTVTRYGDLLS